MPGYLVKTANFVAEINNDEELVHLAEVDTIHKDTQICALPGKTWIEAKKMPILRKVWGLDPGVVPPPIRMRRVSAGSRISGTTIPSGKKPTNMCGRPLSGWEESPGCRILTPLY